MPTAGWAAAAVLLLGGIFLVTEYVLDRIPTLADRAVAAVRALRRLRDEINREGREGADSELHSQKGERPSVEPSDGVGDG